jgi:CRISPR-associated protein Cas5d
MPPHRVRLRVSGPLACFSRPEMKVERVSYEVMTPSAARGIVDAICWHPGMRWVIRRIEVLRPIRFQGFRRNEIQSKVAPGRVHRWMQDPSSYEPQPAGAGSRDATPRNTLALRDVAYVIEAEPLVYEPAGDHIPQKYAAMLERRIARGQYHHAPSLGCREFVCAVSPPDPSEQPIEDSRELGLMLYDIAFRDGGRGNRAVFFRAALDAGVVITDPDVVLPDPTLRSEVLACSSTR